MNFEDDQWQSANKNYLLKEIERIRAALKRSAGTLPDEKAGKTKTARGTKRKASEDRDADSEFQPALLTLCSYFDFSSFERDLLLLCVGMELDSEFPKLCAAVHNDSNMAYPTFRLALSVLDNPIWAAFSPSAALRYWKMIEVAGGPELTRCPLRLDEKVLHYLLGVNHIDQRLIPLVQPLLITRKLAPSQYETAQQMAAIWEQSIEGIAPIFFLYGNQTEDKRSMAAAVTRLLGLDIQIMSAHLLPTSTEDLDNLIRLWDREAILSGKILLLDCDEIESEDPVINRPVNHLMEQIRGLMIVTCRQRRRRAPRHPFLSFDIEKPTPGEQRRLWNQALGEHAKGLESWIERVVFQFNLAPSTINSICLAAFTKVREKESKSVTLDPGTRLWENCRLQARPKLEELVQRIEPKAGWDDLVLPENQLKILRDIALHVRQRGRVYETWDFASKGTRGLGISALFAGVSGTGKTMAAEVLAKELHLDLYRIDLSTVVSKYIGETEKNLRRVFDTAEEAGAILLFDEADALFGKRSEVKDSHDRYANIEVSYLLQRMEEYRGLAILTTNLKESLDKAFMRRLRFIVYFPFPGPEERAAIWGKIFPAKMPMEGVEVNHLARLNISGGDIRNIALNAAFYAAEENTRVTMAHLLQAARSEYTKLEKTLTEEEIKGWT